MRPLALSRLVIRLTPGQEWGALQAGWFVTEFGRQPWIAVGLQRTSDAATLAPHVEYTFFGFSALYVVFTVTTAWLLRRIDRRTSAVSAP